MTQRLLSVFAFAAVLVLGTPHLEAQQRTFAVTNDGGSRVQFVSDAPLETMTGVTSNIEGTMTVDPQNLTQSRGRMVVKVASIRTGIDLRDEHLRGEQWLDAASYPDAVFEVTSVSGARSLSPNQSKDVTLRGRFTLHGATNDVTAKAKVRYVPITEEMRATPGITSNVLRIQGQFKIRLSEYGVAIPGVVRLKVSDEIEVNVNLRATEVPAQSTTAQVSPGSNPPVQNVNTNSPTPSVAPSNSRSSDHRVRPRVPTTRGEQSPAQH